MGGVRAGGDVVLFVGCWTVTCGGLDLMCVHVCVCMWVDL